MSDLVKQGSSTEAQMINDKLGKLMRKQYKRKTFQMISKAQGEKPMKSIQLKELNTYKICMRHEIT